VRPLRDRPHLVVGLGAGGVTEGRAAVSRPGTERIARLFDQAARRYDRQMGFFERLLFGGARAWATSKARGAVVELGVGTGLNLPRYGDRVERVIGVDVSEGMLGVARRRVADHGLRGVELRKGDAQALDLPDATADTVVSTFTFCTIPDPGAASREAHRVLRPGGTFVLAEHGPPTHPLARAVMRAAEPLSILLAADHLTRDPVPYLERAGFTVSEVHRGGLGGMVFRVLARRDDGLGGGSEPPPVADRSLVVGSMAPAPWRGPPAHRRR